MTKKLEKTLEKLEMELQKMESQIQTAEKRKAEILREIDSCQADVLIAARVDSKLTLQESIQAFALFRQLRENGLTLSDTLELLFAEDSANSIDSTGERKESTEITMHTQYEEEKL